jgi:hypothetical protein
MLLNNLPVNLPGRLGCWLGFQTGPLPFFDSLNPQYPSNKLLFSLRNEYNWEKGDNLPVTMCSNYRDVS